MRRSKKASKLCVTGLCEGNSPMTGEFPTQRASNAGNVAIWWRHHVTTLIPWEYLPYTEDYQLISIIYKGIGFLSFLCYHDDIIKWKHFPRYCPFVRGIHRSPVNSPHEGQWRRALMFSLICTWINGWINNREAGDLRRHRAHYDATVMIPWLGASRAGCGLQFSA